MLRALAVKKQMCEILLDECRRVWVVENAVFENAGGDFGVRFRLLFWL